ncbi:MAG: hypothetical protein O9972_22155 [Burkholderiales bacterium]|nr:hypothetical protein [Burkholderiales bacterium]
MSRDPISECYDRLLVDRDYRTAAEEIAEDVEALWRSGALPISLWPESRQWIAGWHVSWSPASRGAAPILVGPKPPSKFRPRYARSTVARPGQFERWSGRF